jgi:phosphoribosyl 1,2-cyclic phosphodiesterase
MSSKTISSDVQVKVNPSSTVNEVTNQPNSNFAVQFWGVRGQIATPGKETIRYGGNTSCLEMKVADKCLIFDGGTGIRELGNHLLSQMPIEAYIFFTHCHWDRIQGFPFFVPAFIPGNKFHIYGAQASNGASFEQRLSSQMLGPNFPVPIQVMQSELDFRELTIGQTEILDDVKIDTEFLNYEHRSIGYRVNYHGLSVVYATDTKKNPELLTKSLMNLAKQADLLIIDTPNNQEFISLQTEEDFWLNYLDAVNMAEVKKIILSTHHPDHDDQRLEQLELQIQKVFPSASLAREKMTLELK